MKEALKKGIEKVIGKKRMSSLLSSYHDLTLFIRRYLNRRFKPLKLSSSLNVHEFQQRGYHTFFGYYDLSPWDQEEKYLLAHRRKGENKALSYKQEVEIGFYSLEDEKKRFHLLGSTRAWCWQQGSRLQWVEKEGKKKIFYNILEEGVFKGRFQDFSNPKEKQDISSPIYVFHPSEDRALTLNFERLHHLRPGYGYLCQKEEPTLEERPSKDGVFLVDFQKEEKKLLFSLKDLANINPRPNMEKAFHYINHLDYSPKGDRFIFYHIWNTSEGKRKSRLFSANASGKELDLLADTEWVSHFTWTEEGKLLAFVGFQNGNKGYYIFDLEKSEAQVVAEGRLTEDGHPSMWDKQTILLDTYPDSLRDQNLYLTSFDGKKRMDLGSIFSPRSYRGEIRCDLHPRISPSGKYIALDSGYRGYRSLVQLEVTKIRGEWK